MFACIHFTIFVLSSISAFLPFGRVSGSKVENGVTNQFTTVLVEPGQASTNGWHVQLHKSSMVSVRYYFTNSFLPEFVQLLSPFQ